MLKRIVTLFFSVALLFTVIFFSCSKDDPANNTPCTALGSLEVRVCDQTQTNYFGPADVYLYATDSARTADVSRTGYLYKRLTSSSSPDKEGALFGLLEAKRYYFYAKFVAGPNTFTGKGDYVVTNCKDAVAICIVKI
jgi:hypothetical protein